jgi:hypothetical protein
MRSPSLRRLLSLGSLLLVLAALFSPVQAAPIPVTGDKDEGPAALAIGVPDLIAFTGQVAGGPAGQIAGLYVDEVLAFPVVQQPSGQAAFVSTAADTLTQFRMAASYGSLGFLAHNTLAGARFTRIVHGDQIVVIFGDGHYAVYRVTQVRRLRAAQPSNPYSSFVDLAGGQTLSAEQLFFETYGVSGRLILQTCIAAQGIDSWGRLFIIAEPIPPEPPGKGAG